jgi:hypothetical protein
MRGRPFQPGNQYGRGRPPGSRNKIGSVVQEALESHAETLMKKCVMLALQGNLTAMKLCIERLVPAPRQRVIKFKLPAIKTITDLTVASEAVVRGATRGQLTPSEGQSFTAMLDDRRRMMESKELDSRVRALEEGRNEQGPEDQDGKKGSS